jgi:hypothetical protein
MLVPPHHPLLAPMVYWPFEASLAKLRNVDSSACASGVEQLGTQHLPSPLRKAHPIVLALAVLHAQVDLAYACRCRSPNN